MYMRRTVWGNGGLLATLMVFMGGRVENGFACRLSNLRSLFYKRYFLHLGGVFRRLNSKLATVLALGAFRIFSVLLVPDSLDTIGFAEEFVRRYAAGGLKLGLYVNWRCSSYYSFGDLLRPMAFSYFQGRMAVRLSMLESEVLLSVGLQRSDMYALARRLGFSIGKVTELAFFLVLTLCQNVHCT